MNLSKEIWDIDKIYGGSFIEYNPNKDKEVVKVINSYPNAELISRYRSLIKKELRQARNKKRFGL